HLAHPSSSPTQTSPSLPPSHVTTTTQQQQQRLAHVLSSPAPHLCLILIHLTLPPSHVTTTMHPPSPSPSLSLILMTIMTNDAPALTLFLVSTMTTMTPPPLPSHLHLPLQERVRNRQLNWQPSLRWPTCQCQLTVFCSYQNFSISSSISWVETPTSPMPASANDGPKWLLTLWKEVDDLLHLFRLLKLISHQHDIALRHSQKQTTGSDSKSMSLVFGP
ncbi:hypothetical protein L210DRAFT_3538767, partial [Boletus edulis BED1]